MATNPEIPPEAIAFAFQGSTSNFQLHKWTPNNAKLPESLQALVHELPLQGRYDSLVITLYSPEVEGTAHIRLDDENHYRNVRHRFFPFIHRHFLSLHDKRCPEKYWLFQFVVELCPTGVDYRSYSSLNRPTIPQTLPTELPQESQSQLSQPKGAFTCFNRLPTELQVAIWLFSLPTGQITHVRHMEEPGLSIRTPPLPSIMFVCKQACEAARLHLQLLPLTDKEGETKTVFCNIETGILLLDHLEYRTDVGDAFDLDRSWCRCRGLHSHLNGRPHPWQSFRYIANCSKYTEGELATGPDIRLDVRVQTKK
ncbi:hypothetical protein EDB81DRAFT_808147 [Dactylonectria macrodidyma]|uniref:2EXR domain-containing protein n=1 Tax=Dactylonectria macrodidyma TaxID=307937 RepID=A0A9P9E3C7_9HYPO|nr:hypothetical protein EDB81DRAFT_808147 [Dactylonectria macrodidyma]